MKLTILSDQGLVRLRNLIATDPKLIFRSLDEIRAEFEGVDLIESNYELDVAESLDVRGSVTADDREAKNARLIYTSLSGLDDAGACDERLWVTLALRDYRAYTFARWGSKLNAKSPKSELKSFFVNHILLSGTRSRWRDQAISRLWWHARYAELVAPEVRDQATALLLGNTELGGQILGKPSIGTSVRMAHAVVIASLGRFSNPKDFNRNKFRYFMKQVDLLAGRRLLNAVNQSDLDAELAQLLESALER